VRRTLLALAVVAGLIPITAVAAQAATAPAGRLMYVAQDTFNHKLHLRGWAYDPAKPASSIAVKFYADGVYLGRVLADDPSADVNKKYGIHGAHRYTVTFTRTQRTAVVIAKTVATPVTTVGSKSVYHYWPSPGSRIITVAKRYVGKSPFVEGGASPSGFDCSGYAKYAYAQASVHWLTHNAEGQRRAMRRIYRSQARPGDLVFYLSGGSAYHVAIYAGHGMQYAAATVRDGIRYQAVWSTSVRYGTDWH
jgi:cell wall-associated NlpC family hydrolase